MEYHVKLIDRKNKAEVVRVEAPSLTAAGLLAEEGWDRPALSVHTLTDDDYWCPGCGMQVALGFDGSSNGRFLIHGDILTGKCDYSGAIPGEGL